MAPIPRPPCLLLPRQACKLTMTANLCTPPIIWPPRPPPRLPALARARPTRSRPNTHMCVYIYTHMYTCIHMRGLRLLLPSPRLPASLHRVWPATMITRLTATSRLRQLCGRFYYFSIVMMILVCATFAFVNYVSALPPPRSSPRPLPSCLVSDNNRATLVLASAAYTTHKLLLSRGLA